MVFIRQMEVITFITTKIKIIIHFILQFLTDQHIRIIFTKKIIYIWQLLTGKTELLENINNLISF